MDVGVRRRDNWGRPRHVRGRDVGRRAAALSARLASLAVSFKTTCMNVKLLDLQEQYLSIRGEVRRVLDEVCDAQDFILGPRVERFEHNLANYCHTKHAIGVSSGTDALL